MPLIVHSLYFLGLGRLRLGRLNQQCLMFPILKRTSHLLMVKSPFWMVTLCLLLKMTIEIVGFPIDSMVMFHSYVNVYQRVNPRWWDNFLKHVAMEKPPAPTTALLPPDRSAFSRASAFRFRRRSWKRKRFLDTFIWEIKKSGILW